MRASVKALSIGALAATSLFIAPAAIAAESTVTVTGGSLTASADNSTLSGVNTSDTASISTGGYNVTISDLRGTGAGWSVSQSVSDFTLAGTSGTTAVTIPAANLTVGSFGNITASAGSVDGATTVRPGTAGALNKVADALAGNGEGTYTVPVNVELNVPSYTRAGTYSATLTTTQTVAPTS